MVVAKWLALCIITSLGILLVLSFPSAGLVLGYALPTYPKRLMHTNAVNVPSEPVGISERWEHSTVPKSGGEGANPNAGTEQLPSEAAFLDRVDKLQFFKGRHTSHQRSWPIPQLHCKDGCDSDEPSVVQCTNVKSPGQKIAKWRCEADLPRHLIFQKSTINCEGFESTEDNRILRGSCGLEYSLTTSGLRPIPGRVHKHYYTINAPPDPQLVDDNVGGWTASWLVVIGVIIYLVNHNWNSFKSPVTEPEGLRAKVATAHQAWKKQALPKRHPRQSN